MFVFILVNACSNVDVHLCNATSVQDAVSQAYLYGIDFKNGCIEFDTIEIWDPEDTLLVALNF